MVQREDKLVVKLAAQLVVRQAAPREVVEQLAGQLVVQRERPQEEEGLKRRSSELDLTFPKWVLLRCQ